jgi:DNA-directed RNA polymerase subunit RPC12/RpoP
MPVIQCRVISKPAEGTKNILSSREIKPFFIFNGSNTYVCGLCGNILADKIREGQIPMQSNTVIECPQCHSFNEII